MHPYVHCNTIYNSQVLETAKGPSLDEWIKKLWYIYKMEYYMAIKKKELLLFVTKWVNLETIMLSEISQSEKDKYHMILPIWEFNKQTDGQNRNRGKGIS